MKVFHGEGKKEPEHSELEALEKLFDKVVKRNSYLSSQCHPHLKLLEKIDGEWVGIIRDIRKEKFVYEVE